MKTIEDLINEYVSKGMTINQAESYISQKIILNKISKSPFADKVLIKGGVVMYHMTHNLRRTTFDLDFDFIRYDISLPSIKKFINTLNRYEEEYIVTANKIEPLHQEDYKGKRVWTSIKDDTYTIRFKLDIGVHTLLGITQLDTCFSFEEDEKVFLKINPPEQIFAEKLYALCKLGASSTRIKDIYDLYYLISQNLLDKGVTKKCIELLLINNRKGISSLEDICQIVSNVFIDKFYINKMESVTEKWIDEDYIVVFKVILDYIYSL